MDKELLNFMYMQGYSSDDTYDEGMIQKARKEMQFHALKQGILKVWSAVKKIVVELWEKVKPIAIALQEAQNQPPATLRASPTFQPVPVLHHQVMDRTPRHAIRKIIR